MGLGKTCQVLSFIFLFHRHVTRNARVLLFVPKSTIVSWSQEISKWQGFYYPSNQGAHQRNAPRRPAVRIFDDSLKREDRLSFLRLLQTGLDVADPSAQADAAGIYILSYEGATNLTMRSGGNDTFTAGGNDGPEIVDAASLHCDLIVCDEAHRLKSDKRIDTRMIRSINTKRRLLLTGTPLQNHLTEYYCMVNVAMPNFFPRRMFRDFFARPIAKSMTKHADARTIEHARQRTFTLIREVDPFVHRRDANVLTRELPKLLEFVVVTKLSPLQARLYDELLAILRKQGKKVNILQGFSYAAKLCAHPQILFDTYKRLALSAFSARGTVGSSTAASTRNEAIDLDDSEIPMTLSDGDGMSSDDDMDGGRKKRARAAKDKNKNAKKTGDEGSKVAPAKTTDQATHARLAKLCEPPRGYEPKSDDSAKMQLALEIMRHCVLRLGEKVLLFSMSTVLLDFVQNLLDNVAQVPGHGALGGYLRIDGSSSSAARREQIEAFQGQGPQPPPPGRSNNKDNNGEEEITVDAEAQQKHSIFLLSTKAGGVGLTLTAATRVIILDCSWNPADDRQAIGRAYRYGQTRPVFVYRLVCSGTMEHRVFDQKVAKEWLFQTVVDSEVVKRDKLKGAKLQNFLFRRGDEDKADGAASLPPEVRRDTDRCLRADATLQTLKNHILSITTHNTMLEEDDDEYGAAEEQFYAEYKKRGGFLAHAGLDNDALAEDAAAIAARKRQTERALEQQSETLARVLDRLVNKRAEEAIRSGALQRSQVTAATGTAAGAAPGRSHPTSAMMNQALAQLLDASVPHRTGTLPTTSRYARPAPRPIVGPGSSKNDALSIDDDDDDDDRQPEQRRLPQPPPPPAAAPAPRSAPMATSNAAAPDDGDDDDVIIVD